jgi:hypothetical protein
MSGEIAMSLPVTLPNELEQFLRTQAHRLGVPIETLLSRTIEERWSAASRAPSLSSYETELLLKLQNAFPLEQTQEYLALCRRSDESTITDAERERLLALIEQRDLQNEERLKTLGELARLRGVTLREVMAQLGIHPE